MHKHGEKNRARYVFLTLLPLLGTAGPSLADFQPPLPPIGWMPAVRAAEVAGGLFFVCLLLLLYCLLGLALAAFCLLGEALWPRRTVRVRDIFAGRLGSATLLGLGNVAGVILLLRLLGRTGAGPLPALILVGCLLYFLFSALPALISALGERILAAAGRAHDPLRGAGAGAISLLVGGLLPIAGQGLLILALAAAAGAGMMALAGPKKPAGATSGARNPAPDTGSSPGMEGGA